jgi:hypothetical protein
MQEKQGSRWEEEEIIDDGKEEKSKEKSDRMGIIYSMEGWRAGLPESDERLRERRRGRELLLRQREAWCAGGEERIR